MTNAKVAVCDFETRSACDLKKHGTWVYSQHESTEVMCMAWRLPTWPKDKTAIWHPAYPKLGIDDEGDGPELVELFQWIQAGGLVEAHNSWFEYCMWKNIMAVRYGWPEVSDHQWRCSAAKAASHALPRGLDDACSALMMKIRKDASGSKVMKKLTKPRKPRKKELEAWKLKNGKKPHPRVYFESFDLFVQLWAYCCQDVLAEEALSAMIPDLSPEETELYLLDQKINARGFQLDSEAVETALALITKETVILNGELKELTGGKVDRATKRAQMVAWFAEHGLAIENTQKQTLEDMLTWAWLSPELRRGVELMFMLGKSSTAKYEAMRNWSIGDWRVRGGLLYHGAGTGRWSGKGVQPHNFPKGDKTVSDMDATWALLKTRDREVITGEWDSVMKPLSYALRGAIIPSSGKHLFVADYASIEARVLLWCAEDEDGLALFRTKGADPYIAMACEIYQRPCNKKDHPQERQLGKAAILGLGFQMGASRFVDSAKTYGVVIDEDFSRGVVDAYRTKFWRVKEMWYATEAAAIAAVQNPGEAFTVGCITYKKEGWFLYCYLPSGRRIVYPNPKVKMGRTSWGTDKLQLSFMGVSATTHQWCEQRTYGGSLVENYVQAIARDLMAAAMVRAEKTGIYQIVLTVHDELVSEAHPLLGSVSAFENLMAEAPEWATDCPIAVEGFEAERYRK